MRSATPISNRSRDCRLLRKIDSIIIAVITTQRFTIYIIYGSDEDEVKKKIELKTNTTIGQW